MIGIGVQLLTKQSAECQMTKADGGTFQCLSPRLNCKGLVHFVHRCLPYVNEFVANQKALAPEGPSLIRGRRGIAIGRTLPIGYVLDKCNCATRLELRGRSTQCEFECKANSSAIVVCVFTNSLCQCVGGIHDQLGVHHQQRLRCDYRCVAMSGWRRWVGEIKLLKQGIEIVANDRQINRTTQTIVFRVIDRCMVENELACLLYTSPSPRDS